MAAAELAAARASSAGPRERRRIRGRYAPAAMTAQAWKNYERSLWKRAAALGVDLGEDAPPAKAARSMPDLKRDAQHF